MRENGILDEHHGPMTTGVTIPLEVGSLSTLLSVIAALCVGVVLYRGRKRLIALIQGNPSFRGTIYIAEPLLTFTLGCMVTAAEVLKGDTWDDPKPYLAILLPAAAALLATSVGIKALMLSAKDSEKEKIKDLQASLEETQQEVGTLKNSRDSAINTASHVGAVLDAKFKRVKEALQIPNLTAAQYLEALAPREQLQVILMMIHGFFASSLPISSKLRAGVYMRSPDNDQVLKPAYSWDGKELGCYGDNAEYMRLDEARSARSMIVQAFRSDDKISVVSSCEREEKEGHFHFWNEGQREYLKSMVTFKHKWNREPANGKVDALLLTLDTDQDGFFGRFEREELTNFFVEMMRRFEYEHASLEVAAKLHKKGIKNP